MRDNVQTRALEGTQVDVRAGARTRTAHACTHRRRAHAHSDGGQIFKITVPDSDIAQLAKRATHRRACGLLSRSRVDARRNLESPR